MPLFEFSCPECSCEIEKVQYSTEIIVYCPECGVEMQRMISSPALIRVKGQGYPSRRKWMDDWTPDSKPFSTGSLHGARY